MNGLPQIPNHSGVGAAAASRPLPCSCETKERLSWLRSVACNEAQGYLFSPPVPMREIPRLLAKWSRLKRTADWVAPASVGDTLPASWTCAVAPC
ncbi:MAG: hypothetical protein ACREC1_07235 [Methylovirgula sp.]